MSKTKTNVNIVNVSDITINSKVAQIVALELMLKQTKAEIEKLKTDVVDYMNDNNYTDIACGTHTVKISEVHGTTFDKELVKELNPRLYEACIKEKPVTHKVTFK